MKLTDIQNQPTDPAATAQPDAATALAKPSHITIEDASCWILRIGVIASAAVMLLGIAISFLHGTTSINRMKKDGFDYHPSHILSGILALRGKSIIELGIYLLVFTPIARVLTSMVIFAVVEKDRLYAVITFVVLVLTLAGLLWLG